MAICYVCNDQARPADTELDGRPIHSFHLNELQVTARSAGDVNSFPRQGREVLGASQAQRGKPTMNEEKHSRKRKALDTARIRELFNAGESVSKIAKQFGVSSSPVIRTLKELGEYRSPRGRKRPKNIPASKAALRESSDGFAVLTLSGGALDAIWNGLELQTKARLIEKLWIE